MSVEPEMLNYLFFFITIVNVIKADYSDVKCGLNFPVLLFVAIPNSYMKQEKRFKNDAEGTVTINAMTS